MQQLYLDAKQGLAARSVWEGEEQAMIAILATTGGATSPRGTVSSFGSTLTIASILSASTTDDGNETWNLADFSVHERQQARRKGGKCEPRKRLLCSRSGPTGAEEYAELLL